ncbi:MAG: serine/threonine-protein phosphatase, partial [Holophagales bacterium]|nr:serine/threonine-protein phosphatase [Holophagales bacterium]
WLVAVADVSGHGLPAGLRMAMVKSAIELLCQEGSDPTHFLRRLHRLLRRPDRDRPDRHQHSRDQHSRGQPGRDQHSREKERRAFVTATLAAIDPRTGTLEMAAAGHPPTYLLRRGQVSEIQLPSPPLGGTLTPTFDSEHRQLEAGDLLVWLSDGLIEATDQHDEAFGYDRVAACLQGLGPDPAAAKQAILEAVAGHYGDGGNLDDDLTLVVMSCGAFPDAPDDGIPQTGTGETPDATSRADSPADAG